MVPLPLVPLPLPIPISDADDPRLADYRHLKERQLNAESGRFIAESERVVRRLLESQLRVHSVLATPTRLGTLADALAASAARGAAAFPIYVASQPTMDTIAGFHVHRGCLAVGQRPENATIPPDARTLVVLEDLVDADNLGAMVRNAAALGADALCLSPACADLFYRKAIRVSIGSVFLLPILRFTQWPDDLLTLRTAGFTLVAATPRPTAVPLPTYRRPEKLALLLGTEGPGLSESVLALADQQVSIPMFPAADSLNVATAGAILLYHLRRA